MQDNYEEAYLAIQNSSVSELNPVQRIDNVASNTSLIPILRLCFSKKEVVVVVRSKS